MKSCDLTIKSGSYQKVIEIFENQAKSIESLSRNLDENFLNAVDLILNTKGRVVLSGVGKSGLIGKKISATFASTGTPGFFVHPTEAFHGDLGMVRSTDLVILISYSGETEEIIRLIPHFRRVGAKLIGLTGQPGSTLGRNTDAVLNISVDREACPNNLAPTNSTLTTLAMGDALAVALIDRRSFKPVDFARRHPGGSLGRKLLTRVKDVMHTERLPIVEPSTTVREALLTVTRGRLGLILVMDGKVLKGILTDGDLRRALQNHGDILSVLVDNIMTNNPITISEDAMLVEAEKLMISKKIKALIAINKSGDVTGVLEVFS